MNTVKALNDQFDANLRKLETLRAQDQNDPLVTAAIHNAEMCMVQLCEEIIEATKGSVGEREQLLMIQDAMLLNSKGTMQ